MISYDGDPLPLRTRNSTLHRCVAVKFPRLSRISTPNAVMVDARAASNQHQVGFVNICHMKGHELPLQQALKDVTY